MTSETGRVYLLLAHAKRPPALGGDLFPATLVVPGLVPGIHARWNSLAAAL